LTGVTVNDPPLHIVAVLAAIVAFGLMVIVTVKLAPEHDPDKGVTIYVAVWLVLVGFVSVPLMFACAAPAAPPVRPPVTAGAAHE
jgi:drug/metabolite transporter (DMT)-like permease